jgi:hypothetical protein
MRGEDGAISAFLVVITMAMVLVAGLVLDGGRVVAARREVQDVAQGAARAGANAVDEAALRAGTTALDGPAAVAAAQGFLAAAGHSGSVTVTALAVEVTVTDSVPMLLLGLGGVGPRSVTAVEQARVVRGVTGPEGP